jgi:hypothetical protein
MQQVWCQFAQNYKFKRVEAQSVVFDQSHGRAASRRGPCQHYFLFYVQLQHIVVFSIARLATPHLLLLASECASYALKPSNSCKNEVHQHTAAGAKTGWRLAWETMVRELAPQDSSGSYTRPANAFNERIGSPGFSVRSLLDTTQIYTQITSAMTSHEGLAS